MKFNKTSGQKGRGTSKIFKDTFDRVILNKPANAPIVREFAESDSSGVTDEHDLKALSSEELDHFSNSSNLEGGVVHNLSNLAQ